MPHGTTEIRLKNGRPASVPVPAYTLGYTVLEDDTTLKIIFALKQPSDESPALLFQRIVKQYPGYDWIEDDGLSAQGHSEGAAAPFTIFEFEKSPDGVLIPVGDFGNAKPALASILSPGPVVGRAVESIEALAKNAKQQKKKEEPRG